MSVAGTVWRPVGPSPIKAGNREDNGTVTCIVVHPANPSIIYRGTNSGGVWKTIDGAVQGWLASKLQSLLATQIDRPCDEGTFSPDDKKC